MQANKGGEGGDPGVFTITHQYLQVYRLYHLISASQTLDNSVLHFDHHPCLATVSRAFRKREAANDTIDILFEDPAKL